MEGLTGEQVILSDLPVQRKQARPRSFFFSPEDPEALANAMRVACQEYNENEEIAMQAVSIAHFLERQREFGKSHERIAANLDQETVNRIK